MRETTAARFVVILLFAQTMIVAIACVYMSMKFDVSPGQVLSAVTAMDVSLHERTRDSDRKLVEAIADVDQRLAQIASETWTRSDTERWLQDNWDALFDLNPSLVKPPNKQTSNR